MAERTVRAEVTQEDIRAGRRSSLMYCPIAVAARKLGVFNPAVDNQTLFFGPYKERSATGLPPEARDFILRFDREGKRAVSPFSFDLTLPEEAFGGKS